MSRFSTLEQIEQLDPVTDHQRIMYLSSQYDFGFANHRALEFALFKTYAAPRMTAVLDKSGEFYQRGQKRYDDTTLILSEIVEHGYDSERGRAAIRRMNNIHRHFPIENDDFMYTLSVFVLEPIRWNALLGWRRFSDKEKQAGFLFWREVGIRMNIKDIPETYEAFERWSLNYEREQFFYGDTNRKIADATISIFAGWVPKFMRPAMQPMVVALIEDDVREAFGYQKSGAWLTWLLKKALRLRAGIIRLLPANTKPYLYTKQKNRTYPQGYEIAELGSLPERSESESAAD